MPPADERLRQMAHRLTKIAERVRDAGLTRTADDLHNLARELHELASPPAEPSGGPSLS